ncbi:MAG: carbon-nitrogen hydrolase family protein [Propioniciclava sp.]|uniref:carbon-nitrogen hydrolase family protein n=1 Tax=Propioniciclava sp. TaxID=2038686 RepID=UPI0039E3C4DF
MTELLRVAACQISATDDPAHNLTQIAEAARDAAARGARVLAFPEAAMVRFGAPLAEVAQPLDGPFADGVRELAAETGALLVVGMFTPSGDGRVRNTLLITGAGVDTHYDKIHLFDAFGARESDTVAPGTGVVTVEAFGTTLGFATCFDLRFPAQFQDLGRRGAEVIVVPASWGEGPGKAEQWDVLTRARAMDAQAWLIACNQAWTPPASSDPLGLGRSVIVEPLGGIRARLGAAADALVADIDPSIVAGIRQRVPIL